MIFLICCVANNGYARLANFDESEISYKNIDIKYEVNASGTYDEYYYALIEIKKDSARTEYGLYRFQYNPFAETLVKLEARTINGKKDFPVSKKDIVIKPVAEKGPGFDTKNQVSIAYPNVEVGSRLEIKYHIKQIKAPIPGLYSEHFNIGNRGLIEKYRKSWISKVPLSFEIIDPNGYFEVVQQTPTNIEVNLKRPLYLKAIEESDSMNDANGIIWMAASNMKTWGDYPMPTIQYYEKTINAPLPLKFQKIYNKAATLTDTVEQINSVTSQLAEEVRYLGDWRLVKGAYHPRSLEQIAKTGYGDCKDFSASTAAILRKLGYTVHAALINRGRYIFKSPIQLPSNNFNHAIIWVKKGDQELWIDPTNDTSYAQGIYPDIENRPALILKPEGAVASKTPTFDFKNYVIQNTLDLYFNKSAEVAGQSRITLTGFGSNFLTGDSLSKSKAQIDHNLAKWVTRISDLIEWKFDNFDLSSRIIKDFATQFTFKARWKPMMTSTGMAYLVPTREVLKKLDIPLHNRTSSLKVNDAHQYISQINLHGENLFVTKEIECAGSNDWFEYSRKLKKAEGKISLSDSLSVKQPIISVEHLKKPQFYEEQKKILSCMSDFAVVFK